MPVPLPTAMPFEHLVAIVDEMMCNASENGHPVWHWPVDQIVGDLVGHSDDVLACDEADIAKAVEMAIERYRTPTDETPDLRYCIQAG